MYLKNGSSGTRIVYRSESDEAVGILNEMRVKPPDRILVGALPESGQEYKGITELLRSA